MRVRAAVAAPGDERDAKGWDERANGLGERGKRQQRCDDDLDSRGSTAARAAVAEHYQTRMRMWLTSANRAIFTRGNLRKLADLPSLGTYWISTLGMMYRRPNLATAPATRATRAVAPAVAAGSR